MIRKSTSAALVAAIAAVLVGSAGYAQSTVGLDRSQARVASAAAGLPLAAASKASPQSIVNGYLQANGRGPDVLASLRVTSSAVSPRGVTHVRMEQLIDGLTVYGTYAKAAVNARGELVHVIDRLAAVSLLQPSRIDASQAATAAVAKLYPSQAASLRVAGVKGNTTEFAGGAFFDRGPLATAVVLPLDNGTLARGWVVETWTMKDNRLHYSVVDGNGQVLEVESRTNTDSYKVFVEDPLKPSGTQPIGTQSVVTGPTPVLDPTKDFTQPSPAGSLGSVAQTTFNIQGNNVRAYLDTDANNAPDSGGTAVTDGNFLSVADLSQQPSTGANKAVAVQNLFYLNNYVHGRLYVHVFNEVNGNFQANNFGKGGLGNDPVSAEAQDGSGTDNANFSTPTDGSAPRMQMYVWNSNPAGLVTVGAANYGAYPSAFGPALTSTGVSGALKAASPADACTALAAGSLTGNVAIVDRGTCDFTVKVLNAQNAGARAVIIANNVAGGAFSGGGTDRKVKIPSAMVTQANGATLKGQAGASAVLKANTNALQVDGDLDSDIVFHEYGHGLTWRMIGSMNGLFAGAIGEGASDTLAFLINGDDAIGEYAMNDPSGIRTAPYASATKTLKNWTANQVHTDGEIYAAAMWEVLEAYTGGQNPLTADDLLGDFVDGMNFTPSAPNPLQMRNGMLASVDANVDATTAKRRCAIWTGFAAKDMGNGAAITISRRGAVTFTESYAVPAGTCP